MICRSFEAVLTRPDFVRVGHPVYRLGMNVERLVAVDWSGDKGAGQRKKIWAGVWTRGGGGKVCGGRVRLESGRTREELIAWLIGMARETPAMVVSIDCCFSYPAWFLREHGCGTVFEFWRHVAAGDGERWLCSGPGPRIRMSGSGEGRSGRLSFPGRATRDDAAYGYGKQGGVWAVGRCGSGRR